MNAGQPFLQHLAFSATPAFSATNECLSGDGNQKLMMPSGITVN
jgi:hypothetical protein